MAGPSAHLLRVFMPLLYIRVGVQKLASLLLLESTLHFCSTTEVFGEGAIWRILIVFFLQVGFALLSILFAWVV